MLDHILRTAEACIINVLTAFSIMTKGCQEFSLIVFLDLTFNTSTQLSQVSIVLFSYCDLPDVFLGHCLFKNT